MPTPRDTLAVLRRIRNRSGTASPGLPDAVIERFAARDARLRRAVAEAVTSAGTVIHDSGGYGMLGLGHSPRAVLAAMSEPRVMANVMTASPGQPRLIRALEAEAAAARSGVAASASS